LIFINTKNFIILLFLFFINIAADDCYLLGQLPKDASWAEDVGKNPNF